MVRSGIDGGIVVQGDGGEGGMAEWCRERGGWRRGEGGVMVREGWRRGEGGGMGYVCRFVGDMWFIR